jgi:hypothetical protein
MELVNRSLQGFVFSNSWIAIGAGCLTYYCSVHCWPFFSHLDLLYALFVSILTFTSYNFQRLIKLGHNDTPSSVRHFWINDHVQLLKILTLLGALVSAVLAYYLLTFPVVLFSIPMGIFVLFYAQVLPLFKGFRSVPLFKNVITALVWTHTILLVPLILNEYESSFLSIIAHFKIELMALFIFIFGVSIPFDIRDINQDQGKIKTFVGIVGIRFSKWLALVCFIVSGYLSFELDWLTFQVIAVIASVLIWFTHPQRSEWFYSLLWDGILVLFGLGVFIEKLI